MIYDLNQNTIEDLNPVELHYYFNGHSLGEPQNVTEIENMLDEIKAQLSDTLKVTPHFHWIKTDENYSHYVENQPKIKYNFYEVSYV